MTKGDIEYSEAWDMPVTVRKWWIRRVNKEVASQGPQPVHPNTPPPWKQQK